MITEDYINFETAKLLKEKGFDENCAALYHLRTGEISQQGVGYVFNNSQWENFVSAPTLQMAMKWLRKKYGLYCSVIFNSHNDWEPCILELHNDKVPKNYLTSCETYEEAAETAIKYCLENLI